jgi:hypothetical protein
VRDVTGDSEEAPTDAQREEMAQRLAKLGFSVRRDHENMLNFEPVAEFFQNAKAGQDGEVTVIRYPWSYITYIRFSCKDGQLTCTYTNYYPPSRFESGKAEAIDEFDYTEKGNVIFHSEGISYYKTGFRVLPLSQESREYYKKYVAPVNIFTQGPLVGNWNSQDFSAIHSEPFHWEWEFEELWRLTTGKRMVAVDSPYYIASPDPMRFDSARFPSEVVENLLQKYFDVPTATLRAMGSYDRNSDTYTFTGFNGGGYSPTLEVSKYQNNADGSLSLWIDFVSLEFGQELSAQSCLTVMPAADGSFKYLSNVYRQRNAL